MEKTALFIDVVGSVKLYQQLGNEVAEGAIRDCVARIEKQVSLHAGRVIKTIGDCVMAELPSPDLAASVTFAVNRVVRGHLASSNVSLLFRMGFHFGPVIERDGDLFGDAVNLAARLCSSAKADHILTTKETAEMLTEDYARTTRLYERTTLKGVDHPVTIIRLLWDGQPATRLFSRTMLEQRTLDLASALKPHIQLVYRDQESLLAAEDLPFTAGRNEGCSLVVPTQFASRLHLRIEHQRRKFILIDESSNGTFVLPDSGRDEPPIFVLHETFTLTGEGQFSLGRKPEGDEDAIRYHVMIPPGGKDTRV